MLGAIQACYKERRMEWDTSKRWRQTSGKLFEMNKDFCQHSLSLYYAPHRSHHLIQLQGSAVREPPLASFYK